MATYFKRRSVLTEIDFSKLTETKIDPIEKAISNLDNEVRTQIETDFRDIFTLAHEGGYEILLQEARIHRIELEETFDGLDGFEAKAFTCFLKYPHLFETAVRLASRYEFSARHSWNLRNLPTTLPPITDKIRNDLSSLICQYFSSTELRGHSCEVDYYDRGNLHYFFAFPSDHARTGMEWEDGGLKRRPLKLAFEIIFVYSKDQGSLSLFVNAKKKAAIELQKIFGRVIWGKELNPESKDGKIYELNLLKSRNFVFRRAPDSGILDVRLKSLRFSVLGSPERKIILEADSSEDPQMIYGFMDEVFSNSPAASGKIPLHLTSITRAEICATLTGGGRKDQSRRLFRLTYPNLCTLKQEGNDLKLKQMLIDSGLEKVHENAQV